MFHRVQDHRLLRQRRIPRLGGARVRGLGGPRQVDLPSLHPDGGENPGSTLHGLVAVRLSRSRSRLTFLLSRWMYAIFDGSTGRYQRGEGVDWMPGMNIRMTLGVDGISRFFVRLNTLLTPLCILASMRGIQKDPAFYYGLFRMREGRVNLVFRATDRLTFYVAFEAVLIPMFLIIGTWGSRARKVRAAYFFFLYTLVGSLLMLLARLRVYHDRGSREMVTVMHGLSQGRVDVETQRWRWLAFFVAFAVKVPMVPVHIWLPEAHVEAPTAGSVILAGILLKLGTYGMVRVLIGFFPEASLYYTPRVYTMAMVAIVYTSMTAIRQTDRKRIIAYASVAHMNMTLVGVFSRTPQGREGALLQMLSHGLVSGALFMCVGVLYDRHHTRRIRYYGGVAQTMPLFVLVFRFFTMANIALPGTSSFVGEFMILVGVFQTNTFVALVSATTMVLGGAYSLWLFNRVAYGNLKTSFVGVSVDLERRERRMLSPLVRLTLIMGVMPEIFLDPMHASVTSRIEQVVDSIH